MTSYEDVFSLTVTVDDTEVTIVDWTSYSFSSDFLTPTDGWTLAIPALAVAPEQRRALLPGAKIVLRLGGAIAARGYIDKIVITADRGSGATIAVSGRDHMAPVVDATIDPRTKFKPEATFRDLAEQCLRPYGFTTVTSTQTKDRDLKTGIPVKTSKSGRVIEASKLEKKLRPHDNEGTFSFIQRIGTQLGYWLWAGAAEGTAIVGEPDFEQEPIGTLIRRARGNDGNVLSGSVTFDITDQPSFIVAEGYQGGEEWGHSKIRVAIMNPFVLSKPDIAAEAEEILKQFDPCPVAPYYAGDNEAKFDAASARAVSTLMGQRTMRNTIARPAFLHDDESKTLEQLTRFARREMSLLTRKSFQASYTIQGHRTDQGAVPCVDSIVHVIDEVAGIDERLWVQGVTLKRSRSAGTTTDLSLIRPYTLML